MDSLPLSFWSWLERHLCRGGSWRASECEGPLSLHCSPGQHSFLLLIRGLYPLLFASSQEGLELYICTKEILNKYLLIEPVYSMTCMAFFLIKTVNVLLVIFFFLTFQDIFGESCCSTTIHLSRPWLHCVLCPAAPSWPGYS